MTKKINGQTLKTYDFVLVFFSFFFLGKTSTIVGCFCGFCCLGSTRRLNREVGFCCCFWSVYQVLNNIGTYASLTYGSYRVGFRLIVCYVLYDPSQNFQTGLD